MQAPGGPGRGYPATGFEHGGVVVSLRRLTDCSAGSSPAGSSKPTPSLLGRRTVRDLRRVLAPGHRGRRPGRLPAEHPPEVRGVPHARIREAGRAPRLLRGETSRQAVTRLKDEPCSSRAPGPRERRPSADPAGPRPRRRDTACSVYPVVVGGGRRLFRGGGGASGVQARRRRRPRVPGSSSPATFAGGRVVTGSFTVENPRTAALCRAVCARRTAQAPRASGLT